MILANSPEEVKKLTVVENQPDVLYAGPVRVRPGGLSVNESNRGVSHDRGH